VPEARSDEGEELARHLPDRPGAFVELGAFDGLSQSTTAWLEANRGWRGILIEPVPEAYERCVRNRPLATVVNCACVSSDYERPTVEMTYAGLMSIVRGARSSDAEDEAWVARGEELQQLTRYTFDAQARTLDSVLDEHGIRSLDLLALDVEGYELEVLRGFELARFRPRYVLAEESGAADVHGYLAARGYRVLAELGRRRFTFDLLYEDAAGG
jgi:FkbM family methyltransferase